MNEEFLSFFYHQLKFFKKYANIKKEVRNENQKI